MEDRCEKTEFCDKLFMNAEPKLSKLRTKGIISDTFQGVKYFSYFSGHSGTETPLRYCPFCGYKLRVKYEKL